MIICFSKILVGATDGSGETSAAINSCFLPLLCQLINIFPTEDSIISDYPKTHFHLDQLIVLSEQL